VVFPKSLIIAQCIGTMSLEPHAPRMGEFPTRDDGVIRVTGMRGNGALNGLTRVTN